MSKLVRLVDGKSWGEMIPKRDNSEFGKRNQTGDQNGIAQRSGYHIELPAKEISKA